MNSLQISVSHTRFESHFWGELPNQLLRLSSKFNYKKFDLIYLDYFLVQTKFTKIILFEALEILNKNGTLIITEEKIELLKIQIEEYLTNSFTYRDIISYSILETENIMTIIIKKNSHENELQNKGWTFGIVTNGSRDEHLMRVIDSIYRLKVSNYEIIVVGKTELSFPNLVIIPFNKKDNLGWITKKKNLIAEIALYENICILHDRIVLDDNWYLGVKKWGNNFEVFSFPVYVKNNNKIYRTNWERVPMSNNFLINERKLWHENASLDPRDWDNDIYVSGVAIAFKKSVWNKFKWDENLFWADAEDIELSHRQTKGGVLIRHNTFASATAEFTSGVILRNWHEYSLIKLGKFNSDIPTIIIFLIKFFDFIGIRRNNFIGILLIKIVKNLYGAKSWK